MSRFMRAGSSVSGGDTHTALRRHVDGTTPREDGQGLGKGPVEFICSYVFIIYIYIYHIYTHSIQVKELELRHGFSRWNLYTCKSFELNNAKQVTRFVQETAHAALICAFLVLSNSSLMTSQ